MNFIEQSEENISITLNKKKLNYQMCVLSAWRLCLAIWAIHHKG